MPPRSIVRDARKSHVGRCEVAAEFHLARVIDQSPEFLRFLSSSGLPLGASGQIVANQAAAGIVTVKVVGRETTLGRAAAEKILVTLANSALIISRAQNRGYIGCTHLASVAFRAFADPAGYVVHNAQAVRSRQSRSWRSARLADRARLGPFDVRDLEA